MHSPIRIAVIGLDHWYAAIPFARRVADGDDTELVTIIDTDPARAAEVAAKVGSVGTGTDPAQAMTDPTVDAVACFTSVDRSPQLCIDAAKAGKHIVAVKPIAMTLDEADAVVAAVEDAAVTFIPSESRRSSPLAERLSQWVHGGRLGELRSGTFQMNSSLPISWPNATGPGWWVDPQRAPGGGWIDHAVYQLDRMAWLFDSPIADVTGVTGRIAHPDLAVEDYGHAIYTLASGAVVTIEDTWVAARGASSNRGALVGSAGSLYYDSTQQMFGWSENGGPWTYTAMPTDTFDTLDTLVRAVRGEQQPSSTARTARSTLAAALDFYATARHA